MGLGQEFNEFARDSREFQGKVIEKLENIDSRMDAYSIWKAKHLEAHEQSLVSELKETRQMNWAKLVFGIGTIFSIVSIIIHFVK